MGAFDDLIPQTAGAAQKAPIAAGGGMFDDLIPKEQEGPGLAVLDFNRPIADVRADIAKIPEGKARDTALNAWADAYVAKERAAVKANDAPTGRLAINPGRIADTVRNVARGAPFVGSFADELDAGTNAILHQITGGRVGAPYDESVAYQRALDRALSKESPVQSTVEQLAGGFAGGGPIAKGVIAGGKNVVDKALRGATVGGTYGYVSGVGNAEGDLAQRHDAALSGEGHLFGVSPAAAGVVIGGALPPVAGSLAWSGSKLSDIAGPTIARYVAEAKALPRRIGFPASADGAMPETAGGNAAAQQIIANQAVRAGLKPQDLPKFFEEADTARRLNSNSFAQNALAPVDIDPAFARLAASAGRASPEAAGYQANFNQTRQTGVTPSGQLPPSAGLAHRPMLAAPMKGRDTQREFGSRFDTQENEVVPMGQGERVGDALRRSFLLEDAGHHGHGSNAYRTGQMLERQLKTEADKLYPKAWKEADDFDLLKPFEELRLMQNEINDPGVRSALNRVMRLFTNATGNGAPLGSASELRRFDLAKQRLDGLIDHYRGKDTFLYRTLSKFKNDVLDAVHGGDRMSPTINKAYGEARGFYSTQKEAIDALEVGRSLFRGDADASIDAFRALETHGLQKLARLGYWSEYQKAAKNLPRGSDATKLFDNARSQEILAEMIPRSQSKSDVFHRRPEQFGKYIGNEKRMVTTSRIEQGGSPTQRNIKDDEAFDMMGKLSGAWDRIRSSGSVVGLSINAAEAMLNKLFGMRADTAASIARQLHTADPNMRRQVIEGVMARMGPSRFEHFTRLMQEHQKSLTAAGASQSATPSER